MEIRIGVIDLGHVTAGGGGGGGGGCCCCCCCCCCCSQHCIAINSGCFYHLNDPCQNPPNPCHGPPPDLYAFPCPNDPNIG